MKRTGDVNQLRSYDPENCGGKVQRLSVARLRITSLAIDLVERHTEGLFPGYAPNRAMIARLREIESGTRVPELVDLNFYGHELREYVRYRRLGYQSLDLAGDDELGREVWNNAHTATLEEYAVLDVDGKALYHESVHPLLESP